MPLFNTAYQLTKVLTSISPDLPNLTATSAVPLTHPTETHLRDARQAEKEAATGDQQRDQRLPLPRLRERVVDGRGERLQKRKLAERQEVSEFPTSM